MYNKSKGIVEEAYDVEFDETNYYLDKKENFDNIRDEGLANTMKTVSIGDIRQRQEEHEDTDPSFSLRVNPPSTTINDQDEPSMTMFKLIILKMMLN